MNFLFHYHLATRDLGPGVAGWGAMLPDLWRMADPRVKPRAPRETETRANHGQRRQLQAGIAHHLALDHQFHQHELCFVGETRAAELFRAEGVRGEKMVLLGHIAWELCLDGALLDRLGLDAVKQALRRDLAAIDPATLEGVLVDHHPPFQQEVAALQVASRRLEGLFQLLAWGEWIDGYQSGLGLTHRLGGIRRRVRLAPLDPEDEQRAARALDQLLAFAHQHLELALAL